MPPVIVMNRFSKLPVAEVLLLSTVAGWAGNQETKTVIEQPPDPTTPPWEINRTKILKLADTINSVRPFDQPRIPGYLRRLFTMLALATLLSACASYGPYHPNTS